MNKTRNFLWIGALLLALSITGVAQAQIGPGPFSAFPSDDPTDGRFMAFGCAGLQTFEQSVAISLAAPAATTDFTINVFDGDTGGVDGLGRRHWDLGTRPLVFRVYADPLRTGSTSPADLIGEWFGNAVNPVVDPGPDPLWTASAAMMPNNDWWAVTIATDAIAQAPSGNYFYNFTIETDGACAPAESLESSLKLATSAPMSFRTPQFGLVGGLRQVANDVPIIYPGSTSTVPATGLFVTAPTTYDGTFTFFFTLPGGELELRLYDGDFDHGTNPAELVSSPSNQPLASCEDLDDPDTDASYTGFPFSTTGATPEGAVNPGFPPDDNRFDTRRRGELGDAFRVGCVRYEVKDPEGNTYFNDNPSGSFEWEQFLIAHPSSPDAGLADGVYSGTSSSLPAGTWQVRVVGLDLSNLNFWFADTCSIRGSGSERSGACPDQAIYLLGDTVFADANGNGTQDAGDAGIAGVLMELVRVSDGEIVATTRTGDTSNPNWAACVASNTGLDTDGLYCFGMDIPGTYIARVAASNFDLLEPLEGLASTTGGEEQTGTIVSTNVLTLDFGYSSNVGNASVGDRVWYDADGDGAQDGGEAGINGVTVELVDDGGVVVATQVTAGDGDYNFTGLNAGDYTVRVVAATLPAGLVQTFDLDGLGSANAAAFTLASGDAKTDVDFGYRGTASVGDRVWVDADGDGVQDGGENGINGVTVELVDGGGVVIATQVTTGDGNYTFTGLDAGNYVVRIVAATLPAGTVQTYDLDDLGTANSATFSLAGGQNRTDVDFGYRGNGSIGDRLWLDFDADGVQDLGENGINGVTVELLDGGGNVLASRVTAGDGEYTFSNLLAASYTVRVVPATIPAGLAASYDLDEIATVNVADVTLGAGQNRTDVDFGYRGVGSLGDRVWLDEDANGAQDVGEFGINGVTAELLDGGGNVLATTVTSGDGNYSFENLPIGTYSVRLVAGTLPAGVVPSFDLDGIATANIATATLTLDQQQRDDVDFGYRGTGSIGDRVWIDTDGDGVQDEGEDGLNGVTVSLLNSASVVIATAVTSGNGNYTFPNLTARTYKVRVETATLPAGVAQTYDLDGLATAHVATAPLAAGQNRTDVDFGYRGAGSIGDRVWIDLDGDGAQDLLEVGINGVTVELVDGGGNFIATDVTAADGNYQFLGLLPGTYSVLVIASSLPAGLAQTFDLDGIGSANQATVVLGPNESNFDVDFGYRGTAKIGDRIWNDVDGDGVQDVGELGINGVDVSLRDSSNNLVAVTTTAGDGQYLFSNLSTGNYSVVVDALTLPAGFVPTFDLDGTGTPHTASASLAAGQIRLDVDFGYRAPTSQTQCVEEAINNPSVQPGGANHALWLPGIGTDYQFTPTPGTFVQNSNGTATIMGIVRSLSSPNNAWYAMINLSGRTSAAPAGSPKKELLASAYFENGGPVNTATWYYYTGFSGTLTGLDNNAGAVLNIVRVGPAFQVGIGANGKNLNFGGSGWFTWTLVSQPTSGACLPSTGQGDVNIDIIECPPSGAPGTGTIGYWKNHSSAWPVESIKIGNVVYTKAQAISLLGTPSRGDKTIDLAKQLIAAKLNILVGNEASCIFAAIAQADAWLKIYPVGSGVRGSSSAWTNTGSALHTKLDNYNNGRLCAPHRN